MPAWFQIDPPVSILLLFFEKSSTAKKLAACAVVLQPAASVFVCRRNGSTDRTSTV